MARAALGRAVTTVAQAAMGCKGFRATRSGDAAGICRPAKRVNRDNLSLSVAARWLSPRPSPRERPGSDRLLTLPGYAGSAPLFTPGGEAGFPAVAGRERRIGRGSASGRVTASGTAGRAGTEPSGSKACGDPVRPAGRAALVGEAGSRGGAAPCGTGRNLPAEAGRARQAAAPPPPSRAGAASGAVGGRLPEASVRTLRRKDGRHGQRKSRCQCETLRRMLTSCSTQA